MSLNQYTPNIMHNVRWIVRSKKTTFAVTSLSSRFGHNEITHWISWRLRGSTSLILRVILRLSVRTGALIGGPVEQERLVMGILLKNVYKNSRKYGYHQWNVIPIMAKNAEVSKQKEISRRKWGRSRKQMVLDDSSSLTWPLLIFFYLTESIL